MDAHYRMCIDCKVSVPAGQFHQHLKTKDHREKRMASKLECGVYMSHLPKGITKEILIDVLQRYGPVRSCSVNQYTGTGIADFETREAAEAFLSSSVQVLNHTIRAEPRLESKQKRIIPPEAAIDKKAIISAVEEACQSPNTNIEEHIGIVLDFIILRDPKRDRKIATILGDLENRLSTLLPGCRAELFGSAVAGLTLPGDPIDISLCDGPHRRSVSLLRRDQCAANIRGLLMNYQFKFANITEIPSASGPVIKFVHNSTRIVCNLVINDTERPKSARQLRWVVCLDERIRLIIVFIKYWAKCLNIIDKLKFSSYAMTMMVLFYLQQLPQPMVPAIRILQDKNIPEIARNIRNRDPLRVLIEGFFGYYAEVALENVVLAPYMGHMLDREMFLKGAASIPPEMLHSGARPLQVNTAIVVQDPYELNFNLTNTVVEGTLLEFQIKCKQAHEMVKTGNLLHILNAHCSPPLAEPAPTAHVINTSFKAARFLQENYLVPEPKNEVVLSKRELFQRWLNVMQVILPDFLINFVRLQVDAQDIPAQQNFCEPPAKIARLSQKSKTCRWNPPDAAEATEGTKRWLCKGRPLVCNWQQRKKAAAELGLAPSIHPIEREVLISKHLEKTHLLGEVNFYFTIKVNEEKEIIRCFFENLDRKAERFLTVAHALVTLLPLWVNYAFDVGFSLRCVTGVYVPGDMEIGGNKDHGPSAAW